jgi:hypothetical protein
MFLAIDFFEINVMLSLKKINDSAVKRGFFGFGAKKLKVSEQCRLLKKTGNFVIYTGQKVLGQ